MDEPLALITPTQKYYYHANHLYSVAALTNSAGAVVERYRYDTYGNRTTLAPDGVTTRAASSYNQQIGFTGRYFDKETGLWYFRARYYSGTLGRFVNRDPGEEGAFGTAMAGYQNGFNLYAGGFVPNYLDPSGRFWPPGTGPHIPYPIGAPTQTGSGSGSYDIESLLWSIAPNSGCIKYDTNLFYKRFMVGPVPGFVSVGIEGTVCAKRCKNKKGKQEIWITGGATVKITGAIGFQVGKKDNDQDKTHNDGKGAEVKGGEATECCPEGIERLAELNATLSAKGTVSYGAGAFSVGVTGSAEIGKCNIKGCNWTIGLHSLSGSYITGEGTAVFAGIEGEGKLNFVLFK